MAKVLVFSTQLLNTGGIESHIFQFCKELSKQDHDIDLLVLNSKIESSKRNVITTFCRRVAFVNDIHSMKLKYFFVYFKILFNKYDILYTNGQGNSIYFLSKLLRFKKHIHHHHTSGDVLDRKTWPVSYVKMMNSAHILIACSQNNATQMSLFLERSVYTIPVFSRSINFEKTIIEKKSDIIHLGYYGRLIPEKGIPVLSQLSIDKDCSNITFHVWGEGKQFNASYFKQPDSSIQFHGSFSTMDELHSVFNILDGYLLLSTHSEGLPVSLLEVMSAGLPWLSTNKGGIPDLFIDDYNTRIIDYQSSFDTIKRNVLGFAENIRQKKTDATLIKKHYQQKYSTDRIIQEWNKMLSQ
ncbi:MAG: glycosyltransferase family 4 protein [Bacteroidota bacterium]